MTNTLLRLLAWALLLAIIVVTLGPIEARPVSHYSAQGERLLAFLALGLVFAIAYPRHLWLVALVVIGSAVGLEALQMVSPGRHGRILDMVAKVTGGTAGIALGWYIARLFASRLYGAARKETP